MSRFSARNIFTLIAAAAIAGLGLLLLLLPYTSFGTTARGVGWMVAAAALLELFIGFTTRREVLSKIEIALGLVTLACALLILLRPQAYPLIFIAIVCLLVRGVGAAVAAFIGRRLWVGVRAGVDLSLAALLIAGAPVAAVISVITASRWPDHGSAVLSNFVAVSMLATGLSLVAFALSRPGAGRTVGSGG